MSHEMTSRTAAEIASQPAVWAEAARWGLLDGARLVGRGRGLIFGCGTSAFVAQVLAALREQAGAGETDAAFASEISPARRYDHAVAICRSATTTEVLEATAALAPGVHRVGVTAVAGPVAEPFGSLVDDLVALPFADEESVVQTRFPTAQIALFRAALGDRTDFASVAAEALDTPLPDLAHVERFVHLGSGASLGLAHEAALKVREMAQAWSESHLALDYRHGPIAVADERTLVQVFGPAPAGLVDELRATGAKVLHGDRDPLGQLVVAQRIALAVCELRGLDADRPNRLTRSVVLSHGPTSGGPS